MYLNADKMESTVLNELYADRCCTFIEGDRRLIGIIDQFHDGTNMVTIKRGSEYFEVPRVNVYV